MSKKTAKKQTPRISARDLSYTAPDGTRVLEAASFSAEGTSVALIGKNGSGKSTLLRLLAGDLVPGGGTLTVKGRIGYLPQEIKRAEGQLVRDLLGISQALRDLELLDSGHASPEVLERLDGKWDLRERCRSLLEDMGLPGLPLTSPLTALSGGEVVRLALCAVLLKDPEILLLDEPTNNLDHDSRKRLLAVVSSWKGLKIIATHDRELLGALEAVAELYEGKCTLYRMPYPEYEEYRKRMNAAARNKVAESEKHLAADRRTLGIVLDRRTHQAAAAERRAKRNLGVTRVNLADGRNKGQTTTSRLRELHRQRIEAAREELKAAKREARPENRIEIDIEQDPVPAGMKILEFSGVNASYGEKPLWNRPLSFFLTGSARMAIIGPNGSGKTTIMRLLQGRLPPCAGTVSLTAKRAVYLDQFLEYLDPGKTILENVWEPNGEVSESHIRTRLARLFFRRDAVHKKVACLSGGEKLRVALAKLFCVKAPPQLLLLDEPTNNLDLDSCEQLESALGGFKGAILVISHDYKFLNNIGAEDCLDLTPYCPGEK
ncbi:MAG: ABC-F family ATP-binding cassette domain-containing protein [Elusimicrobiales bacterium]|nr:ABC-F family ATP-binding cassette domain-containing protein [Elusimicrobiales bacterium]